MSILDFSRDVTDNFGKGHSWSMLRGVRGKKRVKARRKDVRKSDWYKED